MSTSYNRQIHKVTASDIDAVTHQNCTIITNGDYGRNGTYLFKLQYNLSGCGGSESGGSIDIANKPDGWRWEYITWKNTIYGAASCWSFNVFGGYGGIGLNGLLAWNSTYDSVHWCSNSFETEGVTLKMHACDNNVTNFHRSQVNPDPKVFWTTRRRDSSTTPAGPSHGRSCNSTGTGATWTVSDIIVFR